MRDFSRLTTDTFDVLVIGGGIHGATIGYHLVRAGYRTAIVDKGDFCSGTSANSLKILHGGLRYLQHLNIKRMRHSILARREMMRLAPYLVEPLACMMPLYGNGLRGKWVMRAALLVNDIIGRDRNEGLPDAKRLPGGYIVSPKQCEEVIAGIDSRGLKGGAVWHDALAVDTERLVLEYILAGKQSGAVACNYAEVLALTKGDNDCFKVILRDRLEQGERRYRVEARYIVNAAGPWFEGLVPEKRPAGPGRKWALALNIVAGKELFQGYGVALEGRSEYQDNDALLKRGNRLYFFVPWRGYTMIGTEYETSRAHPDSVEVHREMIRNMVNEVNAIYPPAQLELEDITFFHAGLLPMRESDQDSGVQLEKSSSFVSHIESGHDNLLSVKGVKYTTAPHVAAELVDYLKSRCPPSSGRERRVVKPDSTGSWNQDTVKFQRRLETRYGKRAVRILAYLDQDSEDDGRVDQENRLFKAEVNYLVREEMACTLADIVFRRTGLGTAECPQQAVLERAASWMAEILGWDETRRREEVERVLRRYAPLAPARHGRRQELQ